MLLPNSAREENNETRLIGTNHFIFLFSFFIVNFCYVKDLQNLWSTTYLKLRETKKENLPWHKTTTTIIIIIIIITFISIITAPFNLQRYDNTNVLVLVYFFLTFFLQLTVKLHSSRDNGYATNLLLIKYSINIET